MPGLARILVCLASVTGCTGLPPPASPQFDGRYVDDSARTRDGGTVCGPDTQPEALTIAGGHFRYTFLVSHPFLVLPLQPVVGDLRVASDGSSDGGTLYAADAPLSPQNWRPAWVTVVGRVVGTTLQADANSLNCGRHLLLNRD